MRGRALAISGRHFVLTGAVPARMREEDPAVESLIGSEPQRLSFGAPPEVLHSFVEKMKLCWFAAPRRLVRLSLRNRRTRPGEGGSADGYQNVTIFAAASGPEAFEVQFHKYNEKR